MSGKMIVDGYNLIYASDRLRSLLEDDIEAARESLLVELVEYCAREEREMEVVFDAAGTDGAASRESRSDLLTVTFTAGGKTADSYIEGLAYRGKVGEEKTTVVTSDYQQQRIASGAGLLRMSSREFLEEIRDSGERWRAELKARGARRRRVRLDERIPGEVREALQRFRRKR